MACVHQAKAPVMHGTNPRDNETAHVSKYPGSVTSLIQHRTEPMRLGQQHDIQPGDDDRGKKEVEDAVELDRRRFSSSSSSSNSGGHSTVTAQQQFHRASYVPSYVQPLQQVSAKPRLADDRNSVGRQSKTASESRPILKRYKSESFAYGSRSSSVAFDPFSDGPNARRLRRILAEKRQSKVNVKDVVAAMEARVKDTVRPKPPSVKLRSSLNKSNGRTQTQNHSSKVQEPPPKATMSRKAKHRRSMSDPHLHKTFRDIKKLWDNKVETEIRTRENRTASISSTSSNKSSENLYSSSSSNITPSTSKDEEHQQNFHATAPPPTAPKSRPIAPARIQTNVKRTRDVTAAPKSPDVVVSSAPFSGSEKQTEMSANASVSEKALLFGGTGKPPGFQNRKPRSSSPAFVRHRHSWSDDSLDQDSIASKQSTDAANIYDEVARDPPVAPLVIQENARSEDDQLMDNMRNNADVARERRRFGKRGSCDSSFSTDDEDSRRRGSFLDNMKRSSSKENLPLNKRGSLTGKQSPLVIQTTEATIFGGESPSEEKFFNESSPTDEASIKNKRRTSSLHKLIKAPSYAASAPTTPRRSLESTPSPSPASTDDSDLPRPTTLTLLKRERSKTEGDFDRQRPVVPSPNGERHGSLDNHLVRPPLPKAKPGKQKPAAPDRPPTAQQLNKPGDLLKTPRPHSDAPSETSTDSLGTSYSSGITSSLSGEFNAFEEYDKIAQEINDDGAPPVPPQKPSKKLSTAESVDSGSSVRDSLEVPSKRGPSADSWSDFDNSDDGDDESVAGTPNKPRSNSISPSPSASLKEPSEVKRHNIAKELLSTEESYVAVLNLIDQVFHKRIMEAAVQKHIMPETVVNNIFCHIPAIYQFHSSFLLPQLRERLDQWETKPKIGDIMTQAAPFLKMYSLYVQNFDVAINLIKTWSEKSRDFDGIIKSIQKLPECNFLTLQHHMLGPVQRVPRYKMLLEDYVKRLPDDAEEKPVAETALQLISTAATHSNEMMKKMDKFHKLVNVFNRLADVNFDIVDVSRELLREGKIIKISARNGEKYERYLYLFSDMLLCCTPLNRLQGKSYRVTAKIDLDGMEIVDAKNATVPNVFCVNGTQKSMEFATGSAEEKDSWMEAIITAVQEFVERKKSFALRVKSPVEAQGAADAAAFQNGAANQLHHHHEASPVHPAPASANDQLMDDADLGLRAPRWIKDHEVTMCMCCQKPFSTLLRRRHHCRACGRVVCSECSDHKLQLQYEPEKSQKVCNTCFNKLTGRQRTEVDDGEKKGVLEVEADAFSKNSVLAEYLFFSESAKKKAWTKTWCVIPNDELCLYFYGAHQDVRAQMTMPLPGYEVTAVNSNDHKCCFRLSQARKNLFFATNTEATMERWMYALQRASKGEDITRDEVYSLGKQQQSPSNDGHYSAGGSSGDESWES